MRTGSNGARCEVQLAWVRARKGTQIRDRVHGQRRRHRDYERRSSEHRHGDERRGNVVGKPCPLGCRKHGVRRCIHQDCIAVGRHSNDFAHCDHPGTSSPVVDDHSPTLLLRNAIRNNATDNVGEIARGGTPPRIESARLARLAVPKRSGAGSPDMKWLQELLRRGRVGLVAYVPSTCRAKDGLVERPLCLAASGVSQLWRSQRNDTHGA